MKPINFSVYGEPIKTSNSAEGFHSQLNMKLPKHGNFYKFLDMLCDLDVAKANDYVKSISGSVSLYRDKNTYFEKRNKFIEKRVRLLKQNRITLTDILAQFSKMEKCMISKEFINEIHSSDEESNNDEEDNETEESYSQNQKIFCVICCEEERQLLFEPCKHFKVCQSCYQHMTEDSKNKKTNILCPICRRIVKNTVFIYY